MAESSVSSRPRSEQLDMLKTQLQETGRCSVHAVSVAGMVEIVDDLGLDPRTVRIYGGLGDSYLAKKRHS